MNTQEKEILTFLREGNEVNPLLALERFGCMRLAARIQDLRSKGHRIQTTIKKANGKKYASYSLREI